MLREKWRFNDTVENQYYMPKVGSKGRRIQITPVCALCFSDHKAITIAKIRERQSNLEDKKPLPVWCSCFSYNIKLPTVGRSANVYEKGKERTANKQR